MANVYNVERKPIFNLKSFTNTTSDIMGQQAKPCEVKDELKINQGMSHKKHQSLAKDPNSNYFKFVRYHCSQFLLKKIEEDFRLISYDESFIQNMNFQNTGWSKKGSKIKINKKHINQRITLVGAVDSLGHSYLKL